MEYRPKAADSQVGRPRIARQRVTRQGIARTAAKLARASLVVGCFVAFPLFARAQVEKPQSSPSAPAPSDEAAQSLKAALGLETALANAISQAEKSVVAIARERPRTAVRNDDNAIPFFVERGPEDPEYVPHEFGAGVVIDRGGLIVTNHHVVGDPTKNRYWVWVNRRPFLAEVQAADPWLDLAVLKIAANDLEPIRLADPKALRKGQFVIALGNPYAIARDGSPSASWGIVSNLARKAPPSGPRNASGGSETLHHFGTLIQVDCRLPRGTSGGALVNLQGELVGLTTSLAALEGTDAQAGFAIPTNETFRRAIDLLKRGKQPEYGFLGIGPELLALEQRQKGEGGVRVRQIVGGTPAARSELRVGDLITHVDGERVWDGADLIRELSGHAAGAKIELEVQRRERANGPGATVRVAVELSKKYIGGGLTPYSIEAPLSWRGIRVEYSTAIPRFEEHVRELHDQGCVAIIDVQPNSSAWKSGLRPGMFVSHVDAQRVTRPSEFYAAVQEKTGEVHVELTGMKSQDAKRTISP